MADVRTTPPTADDLAREKVLAQAKQVQDLRERVDVIVDEVTTQLTGIRTYHERHPVPCGHTGGWFLDCDGDIITSTGEVNLVHKCFYAHRYDLDDEYRTTAKVEDLL